MTLSRTLCLGDLIGIVACPILLSRVLTGWDWHAWACLAWLGVCCYGLGAGMTPHLEKADRT
jgi:drug/metabolite transporter (DMT)-like permease